MKFNFLIGTAVASLFCTGLVTQAESAGKPVNIIAVVGDDVISDYELDSRLKFLSQTAGLKNTNKPEIKQKVLDTLIDDIIKRQEATRNGISNSEKEIENAIASVEKNMGMSKGDLKKKMKAAGIPYNTLRSQVDADLLWIKNAHFAISPTLTINEEELNERFKQYKEEERKVRFLLGDIFIPATTEQDDEAARKQADEIIRSLQAGESFNTLAMKYSASSSAKDGGDTGWMAEDELDERSVDALKSIKRGQITRPIRTSKGYYIWLLRDKFDINEPQKISLAKVTVPNSYKKNHKDYLKVLRENSQNCPAFIAEGKKIYADGAGMLNDAFLTDFPENVQNVIKNLDPFSVSMGVNDDEKSMYFMICSAPTNKKTKMTKETMKSRIESEKLESAANKKLRELRNATIIENRLSDE